MIDAALELIRDQDEDVRRAAIEILNQTKDERAVKFLIDATRDTDWWVRERAVDALAEIGSKQALPSLVELLGASDDRSLPTIVRAIGKLGDAALIAKILPRLEHDSKEVRLEAITALTRLVDDRERRRCPRPARGRRRGDRRCDREPCSAARSRGPRQPVLERRGRRGAAGAARMAEPARTLLVDRPDIDTLLKAPPEAQRLDISALKPGEVLEGRYKYVQKIGKGAFGTVLLMEDTVVDERLILKFLNPNVSQDEEMMKRFVHELRYSRKITHKNVIRIYDFLFIRGNYAISMEYFPSHTLGHEVNEKPLPLRKAVGYATDIATGMAVAHQVGIIHRDLKPANVLIDDDRPAQDRGLRRGGGAASRATRSSPRPAT